MTTIVPLDAHPDAGTTCQRDNEVNCLHETCLWGCPNGDGGKECIAVSIDADIASLVVGNGETFESRHHLEKVED